PDRRSKLARSAFLGQITRCAGLDRAHRILMLLMHAEHEDAQTRALAFHLLDQLHPALAGHRQIEQEDIEIELTDALHHLMAIPRLAHDVEVDRCLEQLAQSLPDDGVIVGDDDPDHGAGPSPQGSRSSTWVPRPCELETLASPPRSDARSRSPRRPNEFGFRASSDEKPMPSSRTLTDKWPSACSTATSTREAWACLAMLVS